MKRILGLLLTMALLMSVCFTALGDGLFDAPIEITLQGIHALQYNPLDEQRLDELNRLLSHLNISLRTGAVDDTVWSGISIHVDGDTAAAIWTSESPDGAVISLPGAELAYSAFGLTALDALFGSDPMRVSEMMLPDLFLADAETLADALFADENTLEITKESQTVRDTNEVTYGKVTSRRRIPATDGTALTEAILEKCPEGALRRFLSGLTITEIKDCYALCKKDGKAAKVAFTGTVADLKGNPCQVTLEWKLRRGEKKSTDRDHFSLTYKGETGVGSFEFRLNRKSKDEVNYDIYDWKSNGFTVTKGKKDTVHVVRNDGNQVAGEVSIHLSADPKTVLSLSFELLMGESVSGTILWKMTDTDQAFSGEAAIRGIEISELGQPQPAKVEPLPDGRAEREAIAQACHERIAESLIARLVLLDDQNDTLYLRKDLSDETWNEIIAAARELLGLTGGEE